MEEIVRRQGTIITGPSRFGERFLNSVIIGFGSTALSDLPRHAGRLRLQPLQGAAEG